MGLLGKLTGRNSRRTKPGDDEELNAEEEIARNLWKLHRMLPPNSPFKKKWDQFVALLVMYNTVFIVIMVCYSRYNPLSGLYWYEPNTGEVNYAPMIVDYLIDVAFVVDIVLVFRTTYHDSENELVLDKKLIARNYLRSSFRLDFVATFPWELFGLPWGRLEPRARVLRLLRLSKLVKQINVHKQIVRVSQMLWGFLILAHLIGSFWWAIGKAGTNVVGVPRGTTWIARVGLDAGICDLADHSEEANLTVPFNVTACDASYIGIEYMGALYWSLTTLIKTPWVHPDVVIEMLYAVVFVVLGGFSFAVILGNVTAMINSLDKSFAQLNEVKSTLERLVSRYDVPPVLTRRIMQYVQTQWSTTKGLNNQLILNKLPPALRGDILQSMYEDVVKACPMLKRVSGECVRVLLSKLRQEVCLPKEFLLSAGSLCRDVYVLTRGVLQAQPADDGKGKKSAKLRFRAIERTGSIMGLRDPFDKDFRYPFQVVAIKITQVAALAGKDLLDIFAMDNRSDIEVICEVLDKEFVDMNNALDKGKGPLQRRASQTDQVQKATAQSMERRKSERRSSSASSLFERDGSWEEEELHVRVGTIEQAVRACFSEIKATKQELDLLPSLCEKLQVDFGMLEDPE